ncbi:MAG: AraC family transcriptional regulator [Eubacterium sp.]|nr:AraC family transcriptional regulator [Eubacterium sp.]
MRVSDKYIDRIYVTSASRGTNYKMVENHYHNYYELYYVRHGRVAFNVKGTIYTLQSGDFILVPPGNPHYVNYLSSCVRINIYFRREDLATLFIDNLETIYERFLSANVIHTPKTYREIINNIIDRMLAEEGVDDSSSPRMQELLLSELVISCNRNCIYRSASQITESDDTMINVLQYINLNYHTPITLERLAKMCNLSPSYFSKKFKKTTGSGMKEYLTYIRLKHAANELLSTNHTITDIAINCGFNDSNYFKDAFKNMYKMSPREYRTSKKVEGIPEESKNNS